MKEEKKKDKAHTTCDWFQQQLYAARTCRMSAVRVLTSLHSPRGGQSHWASVQQSGCISHPPSEWLLQHSLLTVCTFSSRQGKNISTISPMAMSNSSAAIQTQYWTENVSPRLFYWSFYGCCVTADFVFRRRCPSPKKCLRNANFHHTLSSQIPFATTPLPRGAPILKFTTQSKPGGFVLKSVCVPHRWALQGELWGRQPSQGAVGKVLGGCEVPPTLSHSMVCDSMVLRTASWKCKRTSKFFMVPHQLHPRVTQCTLSSEISLLMAASPKAWKANAGRKNPGQHAFLGQEFSDCVKICLT